MAPGRTVPWCCWEEWQLVRNWLLSQSHSKQRRGIQRVETWRARGRVPLGVDVTASLLETALCDPTFWAQSATAAVAAAAAKGPGTAGSAASSISQQQTRLQYSTTIVRMVNGIADSQQKGRVALSVNSLAEAAGLSRLLVDIRHEATHNELPSLSTLQLAAKQALDWLVVQYWQRQADHLAACHGRVCGILAAVYDSCQAAAAKGTAGAAAADEGEDEQGDVAEAAGHPAGGYSSSEGRKQRRQLLADLKGLLPPSHTPLLVALLLQRDVLQLQQQQQGACRSSGAVRKAQTTAFTSLCKQYPELKQQLLEETVSRLCSSSSSSSSSTDKQQQGEAQPMVVDAIEVPQQQQPEQGCRLLAWLQLLLGDTAAAAAAAAAAAPGISKATGSSSSGRSRGKQPPACGAAAADQALQVLPADTALLSQLLAAVVKARREAAAAAAAGGVTGGQQLQEAQQLLSAALTAASAPASAAGKAARAMQECSSSSIVNGSLLQQLGQLAAPAVGSSSSTAAAAAAAAVTVADGESTKWHEQQQALLQQVTARQLQLLKQRKRKRECAAQACSHGLAAAAAADPACSGAAKRRWRRVSSWAPCAIGCLPSARQPGDVFAALQCAAGAAAAGADDDIHVMGGITGYDAAVGVAAEADQPAGIAAAAEVEAVHLTDCGAGAVEAAAAAVADEQPVVADAGELDGALRFGKHWTLDRHDLRRLQQAVRVLL